MSNRLATSRILLRILGILLILLSLYYILRIAVRPLFGGVPYNVHLQPLITTSVTETLWTILWAGPLVFLAGGLILLSLSFRYVHIAYWSLQIAVWLVGLTAWFAFNHEFTPLPVNPTWLIITIIISLLLLVLYKPVMYLLPKLMRP